MRIFIYPNYKKFADKQILSSFSQDNVCRERRNANLAFISWYSQEKALARENARKNR